MACAITNITDQNGGAVLTKADPAVTQTPQSPEFTLGFAFSVLHSGVWTNVSWRVAPVMVEYRVFSLP